MIFIEWYVKDSFYGKRYKDGSACVSSTKKEFVDHMIQKYGGSRSILYDNCNTIRVQLHAQIELIIHMEDVPVSTDYRAIDLKFDDLILSEITVGGNKN